MYKIKATPNFWTGFAQRCKPGIDWDINGNLFLRCKGKKIASSLKAINSGQWMIASLNISTDDQNETDQKLHLITTNTVTIPPHHASFGPIKAINQTINTLFIWSILDIEASPFLTTEQSELILILTLQKLGFRVPDTYMAVLWNSGGQTLTIKKEHDHLLCKGIWIHGKRPQSNLKIQRK